MSAPTFRYNDRAARYITPSGQFVSQATVNAALHTAVTQSAQDMHALTEQLREGAIDIQTWQAQLAQAAKDSRLAAAALARGGFEQMTQADFGRVGQQVRIAYEHLQAFAQQLANGDIPLDGRVARRAELYVTGANEMYDRQRRVVMAQVGYDEARNVLNATESCEGCLAATDLGWTAVENIPPVGTRDCIARCRCVLEFRRSSAAGAGVAA